MTFYAPTKTCPRFKGLRGGAAAVFITVGTPTRRGNSYADLTYVLAVTEKIALAT